MYTLRGVRVGLVVGFGLVAGLGLVGSGLVGFGRVVGGEGRERLC